MALALVAYAAFWLAFMLGLLPGISHASPFGVVLRLSPIYLLLSFACYSLAVIAWEMINFRDCPEKAVELKKEIEMGMFAPMTREPRVHCHENRRAVDDER